MSVADEAERIWRITPFNRSMIDFDHMVRRPPHDKFFRAPETIKMMHEEQKRIAKVMNLSYLATALLAFVIIINAPVNEAKFSVFGIEAPLSIISKQALSVFMAGVFGFYATQFVSYFVLTMSIQKILNLERQDSWQFFSAPFDASTLWATVISPKTVGYSSPKRAIVLSILILIVSGGTVLAHAVVVMSASLWTAWVALHSGSWLSIALGVGSVIIIFSVILSVLAAFVWKMPFKWPQDQPLPNENAGGDEATPN